MKHHDSRSPLAEESRAAVDDPRVAAAMEAYLVAMEQGAAPSRHEFLAQHADIAEQLTGCLDGLEFVHEAAQILRQSEGFERELKSEEARQPLGDFRIVREIGRGGMGIVYEAVQLSLGRRVALKILPLAAALDPKYLQRFKNEAQAAAQLHHPHIVPVYAVGAERGVHFYAMQLIEGYALSDLIEHRRRLAGKTDLEGGGSEQPTERAVPLPPAFPSATTSREKAEEPAQPQAPALNGETRVKASTLSAQEQRTDVARCRSAATLIKQAALALDYAHLLGVIHRDIKPANLLVDATGNLWVTDFGLALFQVNMKLTRTGDMLGTMRYMSPEQALGDRVVLDHRTDIYALGVTLYELLTLEPVVAGDNPHTVLRRIMEDDPRPPRVIDKHIPVELETIVLKAIAKSPDERYATAAAMADDLQRWLDDRPIQARRQTLLERTARWGRRHRAIVAAAAAFLCLATLGLLISTIVIASAHSNTKAAYQREIQERAAAQESFRQARRAVDTFLELSEEEFASKPPLFQLRRKFLAAALEYYNDFLEQRHDDAAVHEELTKTSTEVARIVEELTALERFASLLLLENLDVLQDLALSIPQRDKIVALLTQAFEDGDLRAGGRGGVAQETTQQVQKIEAEIASVLNPDQARRLKQIAIRQRGPFAFKSPEMVAALQLTPEQRRKFNEIIEAERPDLRHEHGPGGPGPRGPGPGGRGPGEFGPPPKGKFGGSRGGKFGPPPPFGKKGPGRDEFDDFGKGPPPEFGKGPGGRDGKAPPKGPKGKGPPPGGPEGRGPRPGGPPGMREAMERTVARILEILSPEQLAIWKELAGEPLTYDLDWRPD